MKQKIIPGVKIGLCSLVLACAACGRNAPEPIAEGSAVTHETNPSTEELASLPTVNPAAGWTRQVSEAIDDLSTRTGVAAENILVRSARAVTWATSALGCPRPDTSYTEAVEDGLQLLLEADGAIYFYHGKNGASLFYCPKELAKAPAYGPGAEIM